VLTTLRRQTGTGLRLLIVFTVLCGIAYPLLVWGVSRLPGLSGPAEGSVVTDAGGTAVGSSLIGVDPVPADPNADPWFHTRPAAPPTGPTGVAVSGGSNKAGDSSDLLDAVAQRRAAIAAREGVAPQDVPPDAVTASASALDPDISPEYAELQVARVARVTGLSPDRVRELVARASSGRILGFLGEPTVNVTELDLAVRAARG
jgi:K+-transporting ATPase ATPase C chain